MFAAGSSPSSVLIDTDRLILTWNRSNSVVELDGTPRNQSFFIGREWQYQVAEYNLNSTYSEMFASGTNVVVAGTKSVLMSISGDLTVNTTIDVSAQAISYSGKHFHLGGFALASTNCCYVGINILRDFAK